MDDRGGPLGGGEVHAGAPAPDSPAMPVPGNWCGWTAPRHRWFKVRGAERTLIVHIDDATRRLQLLRLVSAETLEECLGLHGRMMALNSDRHRTLMFDRIGNTISMLR